MSVSQFRVDRATGPDPKDILSARQSSSPYKVRGIQGEVEETQNPGYNLRDHCLLPLCTRPRNHSLFDFRVLPSPHNSKFASPETSYPTPRVPFSHAQVPYESSAKHRSELTALFPHQFTITVPVVPRNRNTNSKFRLYPVSSAAPLI